MKKSFKNIFVLLFFLVLAFALVGCFDKPEPPKERVFASIDVVASTFEPSYEYDEFKLEYLKLEITYTDDSTEQIPLTEDMLSEKDLKKLKSAGNPKIQINYCSPSDEIYTWTMTVHLVDSALRDQKLNESGKYGAVVKAIRDGEKINFILEAGSNAASISFTYTFDNSIMQVCNAVMNSSLTGVGKVTLADGKISFAYAQLTNITEEVVLFSVTLVGNFRTSGLNVNENYSNALYTIIDTETFENEEIKNVLYHASVK